MERVEKIREIHYHDAKNTKWYYDIKSNTFYNAANNRLAPSSIQKLLKNKNFMEGINKAKKILGE